VKNEWSYAITRPYSCLYLYLNLKATKETKTLAFEKGIRGCDEKRDCGMETAHEGR